MEKCPICEGESQGVLTYPQGKIFECGLCSHRFLGRGAPFENYDESYFSKEYGDYFTRGRQLQNLGHWYADLLSSHMPHGKLMDVGCAAGFVLKGLIEAGWDGVGLEPNAAMAHFGKEHLGVSIADGCLEDYQTQKQFDVVTLIQVLPHFHDLRCALDNAAKLTRPGGLWLIEWWRLDSFIAWAMGRRWHEYNPPSVRHWFTSKSLDLLMVQYGFGKIAEGRPPKAIATDQLQTRFSWMKSWTKGVSFPYLGDDNQFGLYKKH